MKFLIVNDDSINSEGILILAKLAKKYGKVVICAPKEEQSAKSHSICIKNGIEVTKLPNYLDDIERYSINSTPADCVRYAYYGLKLDFDVVLSGINNGFNAGEDIIYSGTVAGASEAVFCGKKGIAFSSAVNNPQVYNEYFDTIMNFIKNNNLLKRCNLLNINVPNNPNGIIITQQGHTYFDTRFDLIDNLYYQLGESHYERDCDNIDSDIFAIYHNMISISPLTVDRTDYKIFNKKK